MKTNLNMAETMDNENSAEQIVDGKEMGWKKVKEKSKETRII